MSETRRSFLGNIANGIGNFIMGSDEKEYNLVNVARASATFAKPIIGQVSEFVESGKNSLSDSFVWKDYHRGYISTEEAIDLASTTAREVESSEPEEFKIRYEEKIKSKSQVFSYPTPRLESLSQAITDSKEKIQNSEIISKIGSCGYNIYHFLKSGSIKVFVNIKELICKALSFLRNSIRFCDQIIFFFKKNWGIFYKKVNKIILNIKNNPLGYPKKVYYFIYGFFHRIYEKIYHYRHPEVHKSKIAALGSSIKNIGWSWRK
ncbi:unnamed protein product [Cryptosporidium hominis]|uniref:Uncharacterized protein n=1 Tax=Cryptosporidium hominis TaxID=237895 RepID=A0A0S4THU2_CRYHO|nr:hypothetical protein [Cryptosporidium hominis TU502]OLQ16513.1 hypothetical protein ChTU502y2012_382g0240 [Cryptosporidium hominis]PPA65533.1 hypothetical protein ChUKH1_00160 [Cryptosporidium hominis]PPS97726.1 Uncharacterized protein GY17_00000521 [Cryptosporidium hominis]CUV06922.1 unnamed protein product [Cryptosporidium hominis]|eukprot:PPS97726.1 Uncharacterized protein GY17_00000521 [Cryptosporidium hominis]